MGGFKSDSFDPDAFDPDAFELDAVPADGGGFSTDAFDSGAFDSGAFDLDGGTGPAEEAVCQLPGLDVALAFNAPAVGVGDVCLVPVVELECPASALVVEVPKVYNRPRKTPQYQSTDIKALVNFYDRRPEPEVEYQFSNGRKFYREAS